MKKNLVKISCLLVVVVLILASSIAGCGGNTDNNAVKTGITETTGQSANVQGAETSQAVTDWRADTSPITFDAYYNASWFTERWTTDEPTRTTAFITKKTGVALNFITPTGNENEKMTTLIASGDVPDLIFCNFYDENSSKMIKADLLLPLNKLADQYDKTFYEVVKPSQIGWFTREDGNLYDYPNFANSYESAMEIEDKTEVAGDAVMAVRKDIYEAIGKPDMTTPEGFLNGLAAAKEKFPQVDGKPLIPVQFDIADSGSNFFNSTLVQFLGLTKETDGKRPDYFKDPEYITWLKTFRKANEMGLISKDVFIDQKAQVDEKLNNARYFYFTVGKSQVSTINYTLYEQNKDTGKYYIPVEGMRNSKGEDPVITGKTMLDGWMNIYITKKCKDPARAIRFLNYMMGPEGQHDAYFGEEGIIYDMVDGKEVIKKEFLDGTISGDDVAKKYYCYGYNWTFTNLDIIRSFAKQDTPYGPEDDFKAYAAKHFEAFPQYSNAILDPSSEEGIAKANIDLAWGETLPKLILAKSEAEFDDLYNKFLAKRDELGYEKVQAAFQAKVDANREKLGLAK